MGDLKKKKATDDKANKFEAIASELDEQEASIGTINRKRRKIAEARKVLPTYIPMSLYEEFDKITAVYGTSKNTAIVGLIRDYVIEKRKVLGESENK